MIQELNGANSKPQDTFSPASMESNELTVTKRGSRIKSAELHTLEGDFLHQKAIATQKNDLLHVLLEASTHGILAVDTDWSVIAINNLFCETWGLSKNTVYAGTDGWKILEFCMKQTADPERFTFHFRKFLDAPNMFWNTHLYLSNGKIFKSFSAPIIGLNGRRQGRVWEIIDITDDLLKQQELEEAHTALVQKGIQLALALESSGEGVWTWDINKDLFSLNPEFASQYHSLYEVQPIAHFFRSAPSGEQKRYLNILREITKKSSNDRIEFEFRMRTRKNTWRWLILRGVVSDVDSDGVPLIVTGTLVDFTKRKKYENHLRDLNRKILVLSQLTRHDIANQISNLFLLVDALSDTVSDGTVDASTINDMLELMNQGLITVKHQIEFSKDYQELGLHGAKWQSMNKCLEKIGPLLIRPPVELLKGNLPMICADPLLEKALYNLIENSLRHGERVTQIKVTFSVESEYNGVLTFEDNGVGVPNVYKNRIFDKDFGKNTGLGLFLIREIFSLTEMVIAECGKPGQGARFEIQIPSKYWKWEEA
jgi:PAS domain-containing protein